MRVTSPVMSGDTKTIIPSKRGVSVSNLGGKSDSDPMKVAGVGRELVVPESGGATAHH